LQESGDRMSYPDPRYLGEPGELSASYRSVDTGPQLTARSRTEVHYLATGATTDHQFGLYRWDMAGPPAGPGPHFHRTFTESFYILAGTVRLYDGHRWIDAVPGDFMYVPQGGVHGFRHESGEPASMLILFTPGAPREGYFEALGEIAASGRKPSEEEWADLYRRHDTQML
jgi:mannose-6-phosphate isomerase-like protein (cupin superfamily)